MTAKKTGFALRTFNNAGTGETFEGGKAHDFAPGDYANYEAAGLIRATEARPAATKAKKPAPKRAAARKAPAKPSPAPAPAPSPATAPAPVEQPAT